MENDLRKKEFADKYRMLLHNQEVRMFLSNFFRVVKKCNTICKIAGT